MNYDDEPQMKEDICGFCGVECDGKFCSKECRIADIKENCRD